MKERDMQGILDICSLSGKIFKPKSLRYRYNIFYPISADKKSNSEIEFLSKDTTRKISRHVSSSNF